MSTKACSRSECGRIFHVITGLGTGGAETALCRLLESARLRQFEHIVVALCAEGALSIRVRSAGARLVHLNMVSGVPSPFGLARLRRLVGLEKPLVIHGWMYHANLAASLATICRRIPLVWGVRHSLHEFPREKLLTRAVVRLGAGISSWPQRIVYNSRVSARQHEAMGFRREKTQIIPNGFDTSILRPDPEARARVRAELGISSNTFVIGHVARWHPVKDHRIMLQAAAMFLTEYPDTVFLLVGDGVESSNSILAKQVRELGIASKVRLCGRRDDIPALNASLDVAALSSWGEAFPNSLGEAMACGIPCVATAVGDVPDIIGETGVVVRPRDPTDLCAGWRRLREMTSERRRGCGGRARQRILEHYSLDASAQSYLDLYNALESHIDVRNRGTVG